MEIKMLKEYPKYINIVIDWLNNEFGNDNSKNFYKGIIEHSLMDNQLPITFVAVENGVLLGTVGIWRADLLSRQEIYPWLSALIVNPNFRKKGIGQKLQRHALDYCKSRGYSGNKVCIYKYILNNISIEKL